MINRVRTIASRRSSNIVESVSCHASASPARIIVCPTAAETLFSRELCDGEGAGCCEDGEEGEEGEDGEEMHGCLYYRGLWGFEDVTEEVIVRRWWISLIAV